MMTVRCVCGERYDVDEAMAGGEARCPVCNRKMIVPEGRSSAPTPKAGQFGLATAKYVQQTAESNLTPEQARRIAKHRGKQHSRSRRFWNAPMIGAGIGMGFIIALLLCGWGGILIWVLISATIGGFAAFFNHLDRRAAAQEMFLSERELEQQFHEEQDVADDYDEEEGDDEKV